MRALCLTAAAIAGLCLASCDRPAERSDPRPAAFSHDIAADISGYYRPAQEVRFGDWSLDHIFIGQAPGFDSWEGGTRSQTFAPVMIQFREADGAVFPAETAETPGATARVLPTRYEVTDTRVRFEGASSRFGRVSFDGRLDPGALATARRNLGGDGVVLTGTLTAGGETVRDVRLRWWMGD